MTRRKAMRSCRGRAGVGVFRRHMTRHRGIPRAQLLLAATLAIAPVLGRSPAAAQTAASPVEILFLGNSFTHGRYNPALNYNAAPGNSTDSNLVRDLLCPSLTAAGMCASGAEAV